MKVEIFNDERFMTGNLLAKTVNEFIEDKKVVDIKYSLSAYKGMVQGVLVMYEDNE